MIYGYARVSTKEQKLDRQLMELNKIGCEKIYQEKQSGKDFESRTVYQQLKRKLKDGDLLVILSLDRLGRNYQEILDEWESITYKGCDIQVLDMPILNTKNGVEGLDGKFISNLVLQILAYVSQKEREKIKERQRQGIDSAMARGVKFGRPQEYSSLTKLCIYDYVRVNCNAKYYQEKSGVFHSQFWRLVKKVRNKEAI